MEIDSLQWSIILGLSISMWLSQLVITDALQDKIHSSNISCIENETFTWLDSAREPWPNFEPYEFSSQSEFTLLVTPTQSPTGVEPTNSTKMLSFIMFPSTALPVQSSASVKMKPPKSSSPKLGSSPASSIMLTPSLSIKSLLSPTPTSHSPSSTVLPLPSPSPSSLLLPLLSPSPSPISQFDPSETHNTTNGKDSLNYSNVQQVTNSNSTKILNSSFLQIDPTPSIIQQIIKTTSPSLVLSSLSSLPVQSLTLPSSPLLITPSPSSYGAPTPSLIIKISQLSTPSAANQLDPIDTLNNNLTDNHDANSLNQLEDPQAATSDSIKCGGLSDTRFNQPAISPGFLVRSVLKRDDIPLNFDNSTSIFFETRLAEVFKKAYHKQMIGLGVRPDVIKDDVHVKLWNLFWNNSTNDFHIIYQIEQDNQKILPQDLQTVLSHVTHQEMSNILGYNVTIKAEPYVNTLETKNNLAAALEDLDWLPFAMIALSLIVFIFCSLLTLIVWRKNRRSSSNQSSLSGGPNTRPSPRFKSDHLVKPMKSSTKENLVNWRKVSGPGSKRSSLGAGSHGGGGVGLNISGGCSATSGTIDSNHEFEYLSFDSPASSLKLRTAEYRFRRPFTAFPNGGLGSQSRLELTKEKVIPIGELDEIAELSSNDSSHDPHHHHHHHQPSPPIPGSRVTYVTTKEEMIGDYENPSMKLGVDEVDCSVPQLIQVQISEQTQNIIQAIRSELKKFNPITGNNVQSQSQSSTAHFKESTSTSDA